LDGGVRRVRTIVLFPAAVAVLAGCGGTSSPAADAPAASAATTAAPGSGGGPSTGGGPGAGAITRPPAAGNGNAGELPAGFPLPPGTTVGPVSLGGGAITATLTVGQGKTGYDYWRQQLPTAGYAIAKAEMVGGIGEITFSGKGCAAGSQLGISDQNVTLHCTR
jgi:hypothetical protein